MCDKCKIIFNPANMRRTSSENVQQEIFESWDKILPFAAVLENDEQIKVVQAESELGADWLVLDSDWLIQLQRLIFQMFDKHGRF